jgi:hypothetical protein
MSGSSKPGRNIHVSFTGRSPKYAAGDLWIAALTVAAVVGDQVVLDGQNVGVDDGGAFELRGESVADGAELAVEFVGTVVECSEAAAVVQVAVVGPSLGELLRKAAQGPGAMDPKVLSSIVVQSLQCINKTMVGKDANEEN